MIGIEIVQEEEKKIQISEENEDEQLSNDKEFDDNLPFICKAELAKHCTKGDFWTAIDGLVYDVSRYASLHPGGKAIYKGAGKDASEVFHEVHGSLELEATPVAKCLIGRLCEKYVD